MLVKWGKCTGSEWCNLFKLNTAHEYFVEREGIFVIWYTTDEGEISTLFVGAGNLSKEINEIKTDKAILAFESYNVIVSWAEFSKSKFTAAVSSLTKELSPVIENKTFQGKKTLKKIKLNIPWKE